MGDEDFAFGSNRTKRSKKWSVEFSDTVSSRPPIQDKLPPVKIENMTAMLAKSAVAKKISSLAKYKLAQRSWSCRRSLDNVTPPEPLLPYLTGLKTNTLCEECARPALFNSIVCKSCDCIVHKTCMPEGELCRNCQITWESEQSHYKYELNKAIENRRLRYYGKYIAKCVYTYMLRTKFLRKRMIATVFQAMCRKHFMRKKFLQFRKKSLRIVRMEPLSIPKLDNKYLVIFTVIDSAKNSQLFRMDKSLEKFAEGGFIIPGLGTNATLVLTLVTLETGLTHHVIAGQASIALRDIDPYTNQELIFNLSGTIVVC